MVMIVEIAREENLSDANKTIDARGRIIIPGLWHLHCHFREPGLTYKEDFESGTKCAAAGGIVFTVDMPNVSPPTTTLERFEEKNSWEEMLCGLQPLWGRP